MTLNPLSPAQVPEPILGIVRRLRDAGHRAYLVGGAVRELLRGVPIKDWDVGTSATPEEVLTLYPGAITTGVRFGTLTIPTDAGHCEVTTFRIESGYEDARRPGKVTFVRELEEDLKQIGRASC